MAESQVWLLNMSGLVVLLDSGDCYGNDDVCRLLPHVHANNGLLY